ncbi:MAG: arabinofuranosyltransferase [candidate division Zixibacteria bacterium]|nr:arabinofuranosyltransferase [candidate division Zixibacteria bacterium]
MRNKWIRFQAKQYWALSAALLAMAAIGSYLLYYSFPCKPFNEEQLIWDAIWLDSWALLFYLIIVVAWFTPMRWHIRAPLLVWVFAFYGLIVISVVFNGTPFGLNGCWGDQKFRTTMVLKFVTWFIPGDFFYKDLPAFYPPIYYYLLSLGARLLSIEAFKMIKIGSQLIYFLGPFILYFLWRRLVSGYQAFLIVLISFLFCSIDKIVPLAVPHEFVANSLFIPWWLYYIEQVKRPIIGWKEYLTGSLLGGIIFMIYYYPFFIGALLLLLRMIVFRKWTYLKSKTSFRFKPALRVLLFSALFSIPFWLPLLISMIVFGNSAAQQEWHHMGSTGIAFDYHAFNFLGLVFLISIYFALRRKMTRLNRGLLLLLGTVSLYYLLGTFLGAVGKPIILIKANEFLIILAGPFIGLMVATTIRTGFQHGRRGKAVVVVIAALIPVFLNGFNGLIRHPMVKTARTTRVPSWNLDRYEMLQRQGSVFLTAHEALFAFYPVYTFIAHNEHYSHPASRYIQRYRFLNNLQTVRDPFLFNLALRHNRFDHVDFFMPRMKDDNFQILLSLSNYPNRYSHQILHYDPAVVNDTTLFSKEKGDYLYNVLDLRNRFRSDSSEWQIEQNNLISLARMKMLHDDLDSTGQVRMNNYTGSCWSDWNHLTPSGGEKSFGNRIELLNAFSVPAGDSLHLLFAFYVADHFLQDYRVFVHVYPGHEKSYFDNFDFAPTPAVKTWKNGDILICEQTIPDRDDYDKLHLGFFRKNKRLSDGIWLQFGSPTSD